MVDLSAIQEFASGYGLPRGEPLVLRDRSNLLVHLRPAPVVARVPALVTKVRPDPERHQRLDVDLAAYLHARGLPVVAPSTELPPGPHRIGGTICSFWVFHEQLEQRPDPGELRAGIAAMQAALRDYEGELTGLGPLADLRLGAERLSWTDAERVMINTKIDRFTEALEDLPRQPLHGDTHSGNALVTAKGLVWTDFEDAWRGPVDWDYAVAAEGSVPVEPAQRSPVFELCRELRKLHGAMWGQVLRPGPYADAVRSRLTT